MDKFEDTAKSINNLFNLIINELQKASVEEKIEKEVYERTLKNLKEKYSNENSRLLVVPGSNTTKKPTRKVKTEKSYVWEFHPLNKDYSFTRDLKLNGHYFLKDNGSNIIIATIDNNGITKLSEDDAIFLSEKGLAYKVISLTE